MLNNINKNKTIIFIYTSLPGYMFSCIEKLATKVDYKIIVVETSKNKNYPIKFTSNNFSIINYKEFDEIIFNLSETKIRKVFLTGWANYKIIKYANYFSKQEIPLVLLSDQSKMSNLRQKIGKILLKSYLEKFEKIIVPGKSGFDLMVYYGVPQQNISMGLYTADDSIFNEAKTLRDSKGEYPKSFLFDGQFIERKGVPFLINEYKEYIKVSRAPWKLTMVGKGELENIISPEIENLGFVRQSELKEIYANAGCFILPSYEDHWGVVVHQAACSGLPMLISPYCGSYHEFLLNNLNGYLIDPNKKSSLTDAMLMIESLEVNKLKEMGELSFQLSKSFSVDGWVNNFINIIET